VRLRPEGGGENNSHVQLMGGNVGFDVSMIREFGLVVKFTEQGGGLHCSSGCRILGSQI
jgi:hypothetical protein